MSTDEAYSFMPKVDRIGVPRALVKRTIAALISGPWADSVMLEQERTDVAQLLVLLESPPYVGSKP